MTGLILIISRKKCKNYFQKSSNEFLGWLGFDSSRRIAESELSQGEGFSASANVTGYGSIAFVRTLNYANGVLRNQNVQLTSTGTPGNDSLIGTRTNLMGSVSQTAGTDFGSNNGFFALLLRQRVIRIIELVLACGDALNEGQHQTI